ncbi:MAG: GNAT family N-acetyltransferase [Myxococcales bacterium]|nr:GNAT family N-acetyltransferase [Myxococcales bacterium]
MNISFVHRQFDELTLRELYDLLHLRDLVFVVGQRITAECEVDGHDPEYAHVLGRADDGRLVATARVNVAKTPMKVGRVAVHTDLQRAGLGTRLMRYVHDQVMRDAPGEMSAQAHLVPWYASLGWRPQGEVYIEAEIAHRWMVRP